MPMMVNPKSGAEYELIPVENTLIQKTGPKKQGVPNEILDAIDARIDDRRPAYHRILAHDIDTMKSLFHGMTAADASHNLLTIRTIAHRIRGEAGMHGMDGVEAACHLLCTWLDRKLAADARVPDSLPARPEPVSSKTRQIILLHLDAIDLFHRSFRSGNPQPKDAVRELVASLRFMGETDQPVVTDQGHRFDT